MTARRMRARVAFDHLSHVWVVSLWIYDLREVPFFFGSRVFPRWPEALRWAVWRTARSG